MQIIKEKTRQKFKKGPGYGSLILEVEEDA